MLNFLEMKLNLLQMNSEERMYKEYYMAQNDPERLREFLESFKDDSQEHLNLWIPELNPNPIECYNEEDCMSDSRQNISVKKHNRYMPLFKHRHAFFEMVYVLDGIAKITINDEKVNMKTGDICIIAPEATHTVSVFNDDSIVLNILIRKSTFKETFTSQISEDSVLSQFFMRIFYSSDKNSYILFHTEDDDMLNHLLDYLIWEGLNPSEYSTNIMDNLLKTIFCYLLKNHEDNSQVSKTLTTSSTDVITILNYIQQNYATISLQSLADHFNYSTSHLSRLIKKHTGTTFAKILQDIKLKKGCSLLENSNLPIKDISDLIGYESVEYFTRIFKKTYNMTPSEYRQSKALSNISN
jgi:AraC family cel operon transcriptional repressor